MGAQNKTYTLDFMNKWASSGFELYRGQVKTDIPLTFATGNHQSTSKAYDAYLDSQKKLEEQISTGPLTKYIGQLKCEKTLMTTIQQAVTETQKKKLFDDANVVFGISGSTEAAAIYKKGKVSI